MDLIRNAIATALKMTGPQFTPEEAYIDRRPEFTQLVREILEDGEYRTITDEVIRYEGGDSAAAQKFKVTRMWLDSNGNREITKRSVLDHYGIQVIALDIKDFNFDQKTEELIQTKKEAEQKRVAARALAEKAKQDAITAREQGNANIATAKAAEEVEKIKAVTQAQKEFEVAQYNAKRAEEEAKKTRADGEAQAYADRLKVAAGLTPLERATIDKETRIGVAAEIAKVKFPSTMIISGGGANGRGTDPFEAVGLQSLYDLSKKMSQ
jgi:regulator of protease activity HflC (stomatin/prohibitin superfamily)